MRIAVPRETHPGESRVALVPETCKKLIDKGIQILVESGAGESAFFPDEAYRAAGADLGAPTAGVLGEGDLILMVQPPTELQVDQMRSSAMLLTSLLPTANLPVVQRLAARGVTAFSTDAIPRITRAQAMDTLSSMANIAGYRAVLLAANELPRYFPMLSTAAGRVFPANVFIIGAGVAGLQAIATARRLGAVVTATDTRKAVAEQINSLGAKFVGVESAEDAQTASGYAKELSQDYYRRQSEMVARQCASSDVVITTAMIGGVTAPKLITEEMVRGMQPGSVIVDLAAPAGGNCTLTEPGQTVIKFGVKICAPLNLPAEMPKDASTLYSRNLMNFVLAFWKNGRFDLDLNDEIIKGALITHNGEIVHEPDARRIVPRDDLNTALSRGATADQSPSGSEWA